MMHSFRPHDLLWGMTTKLLPNSAPQWVIDAISEQKPVVVRRAMSACNMVAVGIRGIQRSQRFATELPINVITKCIQPECLIEQDLSLFPHLQLKLQQVYNVMQSFNMTWGYTGSVGFELATGLRTVTENSDIDLLIRADEAVPKSLAQTILLRLDHLNMKLDVQLQTPLGGVALREWAGKKGSVLLKRNDAAVLVENPWC